MLKFSKFIAEVPASKLIISGSVSLDDDYRRLCEAIYSFGVIKPVIVQSGTLKVIDGWRRVKAVMSLNASGDLTSESIGIEYLNIKSSQFWPMRRMLNATRRIEPPETEPRARDAALSDIYKTLKEKSFFVDLYPAGLMPAFSFIENNKERKLKIKKMLKPNAL